MCAGCLAEYTSPRRALNCGLPIMDLRCRVRVASRVRLAANTSLACALEMVQEKKDGGPARQGSRPRSLRTRGCTFPVDTRLQPDMDTGRVPLPRTNQCYCRHQQQGCTQTMLPGESGNGSTMLARPCGQRRRAPPAARRAGCSAGLGGGDARVDLGSSLRGRTRPWSALSSPMRPWLRSCSHPVAPGWRCPPAGSGDRMTSRLRPG